MLNNDKQRCLNQVRYLTEQFLSFAEENLLHDSRPGIEVSDRDVENCGKRCHREYDIRKGHDD